jgi:predicted XRE-type DNA-binding protein
VSRKQFASVWDAVEKTPADAAAMKARAELMMAIRSVIDAWGLTQAAAAKRLGITQPRLNDLLRGKLDKFSLEALMTISTNAGIAVRLKITKTAA